MRLNPFNRNNNDEILEEDYPDYGNDDATHFIPEPSAKGHDDELDEDELAAMKSKSLGRLKWAVMIILILMGAAIASTSYVVTRDQEEQRFKDHFEDDATRFISAFYQSQTNNIWAMSTLQAQLFGQIFPNATLDNFQAQTAGDLHTANAASIFFGPMLSSAQQQASWEEYTLQNAQRAEIFMPPGLQGIFQLSDAFTPIYYQPPTDEIKTPIWQITPAESKRQLNLLNLMSVPNVSATVETLIDRKRPYFSPILNQEWNTYFSGGDETIGWPRSLLLAPILEFDAVAGFVGMEVDWITDFDNLRTDTPATVIVLSNSCGQVHSYEIRKGEAIYRGEGDTHDTRYDDMGKSSSVIEWLEIFRSQVRYEIKPENTPETPVGDDEAQANFISENAVCSYEITVYPTQEYDTHWDTRQPRRYLLTTTGMFVSIIFLFFLYDYLVERRQKQVLDSAARSNAIIKSLFPSVVRERLFGKKASARFGGASSVEGAIPTMIGGAGAESVGRMGRRLSNFMVAAAANGNEYMEAPASPSRMTHDEPIAEMFSNTTILFADIAGFTAWSSEREPSQVFKLLETLYHAFDTIAKRLGVFKVETIGDCYVAATGLPEPQPFHAKIMARFAYEILLSTRELVQQLEVLLGPGTSDLELRIGLHSGPVTAGVLRGEKSRFQLFGDTMNTAARMESNGIAGKIQISAATEELIRAAGKHYWLTKRDGTVTAKGKGEMQTWWLMIRRPSSRTLQRDASERSEEFVHEDADDDDEQQENVLDFDLPHLPDNRVWGELGMVEDGTVSSRRSINVKEDRLVDWNAEVLTGFLEKVVHHRVATQTQNSRRFGAFSSNRTWDKDYECLIIDEVAEVITLPRYNARYGRSPDRSQRTLSVGILSQLRDFVGMVASMYREVPFHNFEHASHVTMSANKLLKQIISPGESDASRQQTNSPEVHLSTFGINSDPLTQFAVVFSALIHDVDHTGFPNAQLVKEQDPIANIFNNRSVAEQNSVVVAWELLMQPRFADLQECIFGDEVGRERFRQLVVNAVMATDIVDPDMRLLRKKRWEKAFDSTVPPEIPLTDVDVNRKATIVIEHLLQASDVAHTMQHWHIFLKWNTKLYHEMYRAYEGGRADKDPSVTWYEDQIGFFDHYVIPLAKKLRECGVFGSSGDEYLNYAKLNRDEWERKGKAETANLVRRRGDVRRPLTRRKSSSKQSLPQNRSGMGMTTIPQSPATTSSPL